MEKVMCSYETLFVVRPDLGEEATEAVVNKFTSLIADNGGAVESVNAWGKRRLAYAINDKVEGYYVLVTMKAPTDLPREIERTMGINENILRCLIIKLEEKKHSVKPRPVRVATPVAAEAEAPAVEAETAAE
jgi:small subunit ribosomal protein S6